MIMGLGSDDGGDDGDDVVIGIGQMAQDYRTTAARAVITPPFHPTSVERRGIGESWKEREGCREVMWTTMEK